MIRYRLTTSLGAVVVELPADREDHVAPLTLRGNAEATVLVRQVLSSARSPRGLSLGEQTTPLDLRWAMADTGVQLYLPELMEWAVEKAPARRGQPSSG